MKYKFFLASLMSGFCLAQAINPCEQPFPVWILDPHYRVDLPTPAIPPPVTESVKTGAAVSTLVGMITAVGPTQLAQNARAGLTLDILACNDNLPPQEGPLDWQDSPTQIALGSDDLRYHAGAVLGNWALLLGVSGVWGVVAYRIGVSRAHLPGSFVLPALFLISPTVTSSVTLIRQGDAPEQTLGSCSLIATIAGVGAAGVPMLPRFFKAYWEPQEQEWVDVQANSDWVKRYGELFETYRQARQGYGVIELLTSTAVGTLKSYQALQDNCERLLWAAVGIYDAYAFSQIALRPNRNPRVQYFFSSIAGLQALALTTQAIAAATASEERQQQVRTVTQWVVVVTEYLMMAKTLLDIGLRLKELYQEVWIKKALPVSTSFAKPLPEGSSVDHSLALLDLDEAMGFDSRSSSSTPLTIPKAPEPFLVQEMAEAFELAEFSISEHPGRPDTQVNVKFGLAEEISRALGSDSGEEAGAF